MGLVDTRTGREASPICCWSACSLFELPQGARMRLDPNGDREVWLVVQGKAALRVNGEEHVLPPYQPVDAHKTLPAQLAALEPLILLRCTKPLAAGDASRTRP